ncbi:DUF4230 domain-containing protein [Ectobacillus sp. JY-23]|uniref:DUF4230 domain-containing protein n=1 Tax=Ectobacillus sp. JY-23 TaxID=2933872 RepID=UPI001FF66F3D|nr:DUF4230 domain-containing protein [Ectobacillus sp. JY-23]UOY91116.1 DUF4230 domain-containing protein [Ectobacillus sp. JY-23]
METTRERMREKDERIAQLEKQLLELQEAYGQSAAAVAVNHNSRLLSSPKGKFKFFLKAGGVKIILAIFASLVIIAGIWKFAGSVFKQESVVFVEQVQELATLATVEAHMKEVIHEEDNKIFEKNISIDLPGTKRELLLVVPATVIAGVDLKKVTSEDMVVNEKKKQIDITLPHAKLIQEPAIQMDKVQTIVDGGLFSDSVKWDEGFNFAAEAQKQIRQEAISTGLLDTAEKNAEKVLKEFFKNIGYTVNVTFK